MFSHSLASFIVLGLGIIKAATRSVPSGKYYITSVQSPQDSVQDHGISNGPLFVVSYDGAEQVSTWDIRYANEGAYTIQGDYYGYFAFARSAQDAIVTGSDVMTNFEIESAGEQQYVIKVPNKDLVWTRTNTDRHSHVPHIHLEKAAGKDSQHWVLSSAPVYD